MSFKSRIRKIEKDLNLNSGMRFTDLLNPDYKYKGNPFHSVKDIFNFFNLPEPVPEYDDDHVIKLILNGVLSNESQEMRTLKERTSKEMAKNM